MGKRIFNVLFHLHTVSGIVISVALFVIFFAGTFSFFRDEIANWERNQTVNQHDEIVMDFDAAIDSLSATHDLYGREISFSKYYNERRVGLNLSASADSLANEEAKVGAFFYLDTETFEREDYVSSYGLGEFLYRLHFFAQVPYPYGYYLSGFVAFFFLFAIITGVLVHWDKIVKNFYLFRPWAKLKTLWTDAHTALGLIGLPFQFVYAVTGAFFMLNLLLVAPSVFVLYDGDRDKLYEDLEYNHPTFSMSQERLERRVSVNDFIERTKDRWEGINISHVIVHNYGDRNMHVTVEGRADYSRNFAGVGEVSYQAETGEVVAVKDHINETSYLSVVKILLYQLHYGDYGKIGLRVVSFALGIVSCFVILSGVMIWLVARERKDVSEKRKRFNRWVVWIYLAICMSMYPITALTFVAVKLFDAGQHFIYNFYFIGWLILSLFFSLRKSNFFTNKYTLILGSIFGLMVPIANGLASGNWIWVSLQNELYDVLLVDVMWLLLSGITLFAALKVRSHSEGP